MIGLPHSGLRENGDREADGYVDIHSALKNPVRRRILELLYEHGALSPSDLRRILKISVGTLYYHLDTLGPLVNQTSERKYMLSELGRKVIVSSEINPVIVRPSKSLYWTALERVSLIPLLDRIYSSHFLGLFTVLVFSMVYVGLNLFNHIRPFIFYFLPSSGASVSDALWSVGNLVFILVYFIAAFIALSPRGRVGAGVLNVIALMVAAILPTLLLLTYSLMLFYGILPYGSSSITIVYIIFSVWQLLTYGAALYVMGLPFSKALLPPLALWYVAEALTRVLGLELVF